MAHMTLPPPILDSYSDSYEIAKVYHIPNGGASAARKYAIDHSNSDYLAFCDSDDYVDDDWLLTMYKTLKHHDADFSMIGAYLNDKEINNPVPKNPVLFIWNKNEGISKFLEHIHLNGILWTNLFKRSLFDNLEWRHDMVLAEDGFLIWQIIQKTDKIVKVGLRKYHYMFNVASLTNAKFNFKVYSSIRTLFNRIINDCNNKRELRSFIDSARGLEYRWISTYLYRSVRSDYPEARRAEKEMAGILRKGGLKRLSRLKDYKSKILTLMLAVSPMMVRRLLRLLKK